MQADTKPYVKNKLKGLYKSAIQDCETEGEAIRKCLDIINEIRQTLRSKPRKTGLYNKETSIRRGALMKMVSYRLVELYSAKLAHFYNLSCNKPHKRCHSSYLAIVTTRRHHYAEQIRPIVRMSPKWVTWSQLWSKVLKMTNRTGF